ncbi:carboxypeptidase-like regulatory domain-containing protein [Flavobacterium sp. DGU11]|uniref:Carboxypeptidase-like regulatory domain-containing protein n=1 Tax=Flavobacterium arundinis TaxID=3139143 RepID=A0ABU9I1M1_9FLAO
MENQDKLYQQFREAAGEAETKGFDRMETLWGRVEDKLDAEKQRKAATWWKYTGMAAVLLMFITVGTFLYRNEGGPSVDPSGIPENNVTVIDRQKVKETFEPSKENTIREEIVQVDTNNSELKQKDTDSVYFIKGAHFTKAKDLSNPEYVFYAPKIKFIPGSTIAGETFQNNIIDPSITSRGFVTGDNAERKDSNSETSKEYLAKGSSSINRDGTITFNGIVTDSQGVPVPGVIVKVEGTNTVVQTDFDGKYSINAKEGEKLIASYVGMQNGSILAYQANTNRPIKLAENTSLESVTLEYRKAPGRPVASGAITSIAIDTTVVVNRGLLPSVNGTVAEIDEGKVKSREKTYNETPSQANGFAAKKTSKEQQSAPDDKSNAGSVQSSQGQVIVRGQSSSLPEGPLYVIDGVPVSSDVFKNLNSEDIVSITVLKDASVTALYGSRGASGVIIIKTKKGLTKREIRKLKREQKRAARKAP